MILSRVQFRLILEHLVMEIKLLILLAVRYMMAKYD